MGVSWMYMGALRFKSQEGESQKGFVTIVIKDNFLQFQVIRCV